MTPETKRKIQLALILAFLVAGTRTALIFYERWTPRKSVQAPPLNPDYYVVPKKLYPYDLKSARELTTQPVWVKEGYRYKYYPFSATAHRTDFAHEAGLLLPLQKLEIKEVITDKAPNAGAQKAIMAGFENEG